MKRNFTKILAAFALLVFIAPSMVAWGQTTVSYGWETSDDATKWTITDAIVATSGQGNTGTYAGKINTNHTYVQFKEQVYVTSFSFAFKRTSNNSNYNVYIETSTDGNTWTAVETYTMDSFLNGTYSTQTHTFDGTTQYYVRFHCYNTTAVRYVDDVSITYATSAATVATPTFSPAAGAYTSAQSVTINCETENSTIYYTTDGSTPDNTSTQYNGAITVSETTTIKAIAYVGTDASSVASATYTIVNLEHAGTEADPYSVADARAAIDAGVGLSNVYATGIVKAIPYAYTQSNGITFNMVDDEEDTDFLQAYKCQGTEAPNVVVGDVAVVYGNLTKFGTTYEFAQGCQVVSLTHPAGTVLDPVFSLAAGGYSGTKSVEITCATEGATIYYTTNGTEPTNASTQYSGAISVSSNTTIKAIAYVGANYSEVVTASYLLLTDANTTVNTVAEALAFSSYPQNGVFVSGTVCTAPSSLISGGMLTYYISADGTETNRLQVYKGKNMDNTVFETKDDIQMGDIVTVYGNVKIYNDEKEFDQGNYLVAFERPETPVVPVINAPATVTLEYDATSGEFEYSIENPVQGTNLNATTTAEWISNITVGESAVTFTCSANEGSVDRTATITLAYEGADNVTVTVTQGHYTESYTGEGTFNKVTSLDDLEDGAYYVLYGVNGNYKGAMNSTCSGGKMGVTSVTVTNDAITNPETTIVWKLEANGNNWNLYNEASEKYCVINLNKTEGFALVDEPGNDYYTVSVADGDFSFVGQYGNRMISIYQSDFRAYASSNAKPLYLYKLGEASQDPYFTADNVEIEYNAVEGSIAYTVNNPVAGGTVTAEVTDGEWLTLGQGTSNPISFTCSANTDYTSREATVTLTYTYNNSKPAVTATVTVTQEGAPYPETTYTLATSIVSGKTYIIASEVFVDEALAMGKQNSNNRAAVSISVDGTTATVSTAEVYEFVISTDATNSEWYNIYDAANNGYLYAAGGSGSSAGNQLKVQDELTDNGRWTIVFNDGVATITAQGDAVRNIIRYNSTNNIFSCYGSGQSDVYLYVKNDTYTLDITGYTDVTEGTNNKGYYLIASPVTVDPATVEGMTTGDFDLYYFDDSQDDEWINYRASETTINHFNLVPGKGYLYAKKATTENPSYEFSLTGAPYNNQPIQLVQGWNLIGNPYAETAYIGREFYTMNGDGNGLIVCTTVNDPIAAMQGVFVDATETGTVSFSTTAPTNNGKGVALNLSKATRGASTIDRAIVRFDEGQQLPKFQLFENSTKLYIPQGNKDFAIVRSAAEGEMPVNFRASENGTYTLSIEAENVEMNYLHLIDNMTGADVDLLATPNYTFEARTNDYTSRFRLVFSAEENGASTDSATFAYFNGTSWTVSNTGDATLQVVDITGRIVSSETINGNATVSLNQPAGIYMLRLVNGNDVKVQKVVVR